MAGAASTLSCWASKFVPCMLSFRPETKNEPFSALPPDFGTTVIDGPPVSASPRFPEIVNVISAVFCMSGM